MTRVDPGAKTNYWWVASLHVIDAELAACAAEGVTGAALVKRVRAVYPFGERAHWPYQEWLKAVRWRLAPLGLATPLPVVDVMTAQDRETQMQAGQLDMFATPTTDGGGR